MKPALPHMLAAASIAALALTACETTKDPNATDAPANKSAEVAFQKTVKPLFEQRCVWCHHDGKPSAGLNFQKRETVLAPSSRFIVAGKPENSRLYIAVTRPNSHPQVMPGDGWGISAPQRNALEVWIQAGAPWPEGKKGKIVRKPYRVEMDDYL